MSKLIESVETLLRNSYSGPGAYADGVKDAIAVIHKHETQHFAMVQDHLRQHDILLEIMRGMVGHGLNLAHVLDTAAKDILNRLLRRGYLAVPTDWMAIETAPRDGTVILVGKEGCAVSLPAYWNDETRSFRKHGAGSRFDDGFDLVGELSKPTHWMHLPQPPKGQPTMGSVESPS